MNIEVIKLLYENLKSLYSFEFPKKYPSTLQQRYYRIDKICCDIDLIGKSINNDSISYKNFTLLSSYLLITHDYLSALSSYIGNAKCLEIMCGTGCLSYGLRSYGTDVIPTNKKENNSNYLIGSEWCDDIVDIDALKAIEIYGKDVDFIITSFPCPKDALDYKCILKMREVNPNCKMIYIGNVLRGKESYVSNDFCQHVRDTGQMILLDDINQYMYHRYGVFDYTYLIK